MTPMEDVADDTGLDGYVLEDQIGFRLRIANQRHLEIFASNVTDVTPTQFATLVKLKEAGVLSQNHLGRLVAMDAATTKGVIDRLRIKGLVVSTPSTTDLRRLDVTLSPEGDAFVTALIPVARSISAQTTQNLTQRELTQLLALLQKL
jgi:DNA-binding MarR family transcriptional regulator